MIRTQVYLTAKEKKTLMQLSKQTGQSQSELIREAIDMFCLSIQERRSFTQIIQSTAGTWKDNDFDFAALRKEGDRKFK